MRGDDRSAERKLVVRAPVLAVVFVAVGPLLPEIVVTPLQLLGWTTSGISLFASGVILRAQKPTISAAVVMSTVLRLAIVPRVALLMFQLLGLTGAALSGSAHSLPTRRTVNHEGVADECAHEFR